MPIRRSELLKTAVSPKPDAQADYGLRADPSRCSRMRFAESRCTACADACPSGAIGLGEDIDIDDAKCTGCLLCVSACPSGCLGAAGPSLRSIAARLEGIPRPVLGCSAKPDLPAHERAPCLGFLSEEHLVFLYANLRSPLQISLAGCRDCPKGPAADAIKEKLERAAEKVSSRILDRIELVHDPDKLRYREPVVDRGGFFAELGKIARRAASEALAASENVGPPTDYSCKKLPARRALLIRSLDLLSYEDRRRALSAYAFSVFVDDSCDGCASCAAICPTGALKEGEDDSSPLLYKAALCTGCGLCQDFCVNDSLRLVPDQDAANPDRWKPVKGSPGR